MVKLVAIVPFYNDFKALQRLLLHLSEIDLPVILCDGRFHNFKKIDDSDLSTDGSRFLVAGFKNATLIEAGPSHIEEKFNKLFHEAARLGYTHAVLLGCDEYPDGDIRILKENLEKIDQTGPMLISIPFEEHKQKLDKPKEFIERIFFMPGLITSKEGHNSFFSTSDNDTDNKDQMEPYSVVIKGITIHHDNSIRNKERNELMSDYQQKIKEKQF